MNLASEAMFLESAKINQLLEPEEGSQGYAYYCKLCEEVLVLSKRAINPRKVSLIFNETCPGCGFSLGVVLECKASRIPIGRDVLVNPRCTSGNYLADQHGGLLNPR